MRTPPAPEMTFGFLIQLVFCEKKTMWFIGVEVEQETGAPPPKKNPGSAPATFVENNLTKSLLKKIVNKIHLSSGGIIQLKAGILATNSSNSCS